MDVRACSECAICVRAPCRLAASWTASLAFASRSPGIALAAASPTARRAEPEAEAECQAPPGVRATRRRRIQDPRASPEAWVTVASIMIIIDHDDFNLKLSPLALLHVH